MPGGKLWYAVGVRLAGKTPEAKLVGFRGFLAWIAPYPRVCRTVPCLCSSKEKKDDEQKYISLQV